MRTDSFTGKIIRGALVFYLLNIFRTKQTKVTTTIFRFLGVKVSDKLIFHLAVYNTDACVPLLAGEGILNFSNKILAEFLKNLFLMLFKFV